MNNKDMVSETKQEVIRTYNRANPHITTCMYCEKNINNPTIVKVRLFPNDADKFYPILVCSNCKRKIAKKDFVLIFNPEFFAILTAHESNVADINLSNELLKEYFNNVVSS